MEEYIEIFEYLEKNGMKDLYKKLEMHNNNLLKDIRELKDELMIMILYNSSVTKKYEIKDNNDNDDDIDNDDDYD